MTASVVLAPKLSALHTAFPRADFSVVALCVAACGGVPDHAAEVRQQLAQHKFVYPVLDAEAGPIDDPTRERFPWAPHALVVDNEGRVLRTCGRDGATIRIGDREQSICREYLDHTDRDYSRVERDSEKVTIDGREVKARVTQAAPASAPASR